MTANDPQTHACADAPFNIAKTCRHTNSPTRMPRRSAWSCMRTLLAVIPPSTRRTSSGTPQSALMASRTSRVRKHTASSVARATSGAAHESAIAAHARCGAAKHLTNVAAVARSSEAHNDTASVIAPVRRKETRKCRHKVHVTSVFHFRGLRHGRAKSSASHTVGLRERASCL